MRLFFATDLHGSEVCFRKLLGAGPVYGADVLLMGGDCTGKMVVPLVRRADGSLTCEWSGERHVLRDDDAREAVARKIRNTGFYPVVLDEAEHGRLMVDDEARRVLFSRLMLETLAGWLALARERLAGSGRLLVVTPGNDDEFAVDDVLAAGALEGTVLAPEGRVVELPGGYELLSLGWANPTPWSTPRECSEDDLAARIDALAGQVRDMSRAIFNIHVPPHGSGLDAAPELEDGGARLRRGGAVLASVGSTAVADAIRRYQPLLSLHGHIHESRAVQRIGRTVSINPGSAYADWSLQGVVVELKRDRVAKYITTTG